MNTFRITSENINERLAHLLKSDDVDDQIAAADLFNLMGRKDLAIKTFSSIVVRWPERAGRVLMVMGETESEQGDVQSAIRATDYLERAIAAGQKTAEAYAFLGLAYYRTGRIDKAIESLEKAIEINPDRKDAKDFLEIVKQTRP